MSDDHDATRAAAALAEALTHLDAAHTAISEGRNAYPDTAADPVYTTVCQNLVVTVQHVQALKLIAEAWTEREGVGG